MAIPLTGAISMSMFNTELGRASNTANSSLAGGSTPAVGSQFWLANQSGSLNQTAPHAMSEWRGYAAAPTPLVYYNFGYGSWTGTGTTAINLGSGGNTYDAAISGSPTYKNSTCSYPEYCGFLSASGGGYLLVPGTTALYGSDNFTWTVYHRMEGNIGTGLGGLMWSEAGTKNFLWGYLNVGNYSSPNTPTFARIDTPSSQYYATINGTEYNGFGGVGGYFQAYHKVLATTLVKNGNSFTQYFYEYGGTFYKGWDVTITDWSIGSTSQKLAIGARNDGSYYINQYLYGAQIYTSALTATQVQSVNDDFFYTLSSCC